MYNFVVFPNQIKDDLVEKNFFRDKSFSVKLFIVHLKLVVFGTTQNYRCFWKWE